MLLSPFYPNVRTRTGTVAIGTVCVLVCVTRLSKLSRRGLNRDMTSDKSAGWKHSNSLSSLSDAAQNVCLIKTLCVLVGASLLYLFPFSFSFSISILPPPPFLISSLLPSPLCLQSAIESLFGASLTGVAYSLFAGQPLTILGSTGPVLVFEKILFKFCK